MTQILAALAWLVATPVYSQETTETIMTTGMGSTIESAIQNAARNALTQAVGQFVDTETQISKRTEIRDGVREITKDMSENISASSNGTIQEIVVLEQQNNNGIFEVDAAVTVRLEDLKRAMSATVQTEAAISVGALAALQSQRQNLQGKTEIIERKLLKPLAGLKYWGVQFGETKDLRSSIVNGMYRSDLPAGSSNFLYDITTGKTMRGGMDAYLSRMDRTGFSYLQTELLVGYTGETIQAWRQDIESVSSQKSRIELSTFRNSIFSNFSGSSASSFLYCLAEVEYADCYKIDGVSIKDSELLQYFARQISLSQPTRGSDRKPNLTVNILDVENKIVLGTNIAAPDEYNLSYWGSGAVSGWMMASGVYPLNDNFLPYQVFNLGSSKKPAFAVVVFEKSAVDLMIVMEGHHLDRAQSFSFDYTPAARLKGVSLD